MFFKIILFIQSPTIPFYSRLSGVISLSVIVNVDGVLKTLLATWATGQLSPNTLINGVEMKPAPSGTMETLPLLTECPSNQVRVRWSQRSMVSSPGERKNSSSWPTNLAWPCPKVTTHKLSLRSDLPPPETCPNGLPVGSWPTPEPWSLDPPEAWSPDSSETTYCMTSSVKLLNPWVRWDQTRRKQLQDKKSEAPSGCWYEVPTFQCKQAPDQPCPMQEPWPHKATWNVVGTTEEPNDTF